MMLLKFISHVIAGAIYWFPEGEAAGSSAAWIYSINYNLWYNLATLLVAIIVTPILIKRLRKVTASKFIGIKEA